MKSAFKYTVLIAIMLLGLFACKKDDLDFDKLSKRIQNERELAAPLVFGKFSIRQFIETHQDSIVTINGDTVTVYFRDDSLFSFSASDFTEIPEQGAITYVSSVDSDIPVMGISVIDTSALEVDSSYIMTLTNSMRIDSVFLNTGELTVDINNTFNHQITLVLSTSSLRKPNGDIFIDSVTNIPPRSQRSARFDVSNYRLISHKEVDNSRSLHVNFHPIIYNTESQVLISASNSLTIDFGFGNLNDFDAAFGFFGYRTEQYDTVLADFAPELLEGMEGTLNVTNPKIHLVYDQSFGFGAAFDLYMESYHSNRADVVIDPPAGGVNFSPSYLAPDYSGRTSWTRATVSNIDELISFPFPEGILIRGDFFTNQGEDSLTAQNYALGTSKLTMGLEVEVPLELRADLTYTDTIPFDALSGDETSEVEIDRANLNYWFLNYFPVGFDAYLVLLDTVANVTMDTIFLNTNPGSTFIVPAKVDANGNVEKSLVSKQEGVVQMNKKATENLLNVATHIIVKAKLMTTDFNSVRIGADSELQFHFGIDSKLTYTTYN